MKAPLRGFGGVGAFYEFEIEFEHEHEHEHEFEIEHPGQKHQSITLSLSKRDQNLFMSQLSSST